MNSTIIIHAIPSDQLTGAISVPVHQTSTFIQETPGVNKGFDYARSNNSICKVLEVTKQGVFSDILKLSNQLN